MIKQHILAVAEGNKLENTARFFGRRTSPQSKWRQNIDYLDLLRWDAVELFTSGHLIIFHNIHWGSCYSLPAHDCGVCHTIVLYEKLCGLFSKLFLAIWQVQGGIGELVAMPRLSDFNFAAKLFVFAATKADEHIRAAKVK